MTGDDLPSGIEECIGLLADHGFDVRESETDASTPAVCADRGEACVDIVATDDGQWWITARAPDMPVLSEMYDRPRRVRREARRWLDDFED